MAISYISASNLARIVALISEERQSSPRVGEEQAGWHATCKKYTAGEMLRVKQTCQP